MNLDFSHIPGSTPQQWAPESIWNFSQESFWTTLEQGNAEPFTFYQTLIDQMYPGKSKYPRRVYHELAHVICNPTDNIFDPMHGMPFFFSLQKSDHPTSDIVMETEVIVLANKIQNFVEIQNPELGRFQKKRIAQQMSSYSSKVHTPMLLKQIEVFERKWPIKKAWRRLQAVYAQVESRRAELEMIRAEQLKKQLEKKKEREIVFSISISS